MRLSNGQDNVKQVGHYQIDRITRDGGDGEWSATDIKIWAETGTSGIAEWNPASHMHP
jgi:hypothetical protein